MFTNIFKYNYANNLSYVCMTNFRGCMMKDGMDLVYLCIINLLVFVEGVFLAVIMLSLSILEQIVSKFRELYNKQKVI